ncbi:MAG: hypothetical protein WA125_02770 [Desulfosporosinus sp.]
MKIYIRHQLIFAFLFLIGMVLTIHLTHQYALSIQSLPNHPDELNIFYWLTPSFAVIQTGNLILLWGGALACIFGTTIPDIKESQSLNHIIRNIILIVVFILEFSVISIVSTYIYEKIFISIQINLTINILQHSIKMFIATYLYLLFWALLGYGLKLSLKYKILAIIIVLIIQIAEYFYIIIQNPSLEKYLPYALSRQIVASQFPFWEDGSWAAIPGTIIYASSPMIVDDRYNILFIKPWLIFMFLLWYLFLAYALFIFRNLSETKKIF